MLTKLPITTCVKSSKVLQQKVTFSGNHGLALHCRHREVVECAMKVLVNHCIVIGK